MEDNSANPDIQRFLAHLSLRSQKRALATNLNTFPYNSLYGTVESEVVWRVWLDSDSNPQVINSGNVTQVPGTGRYRLYCDVPSFDKDHFHRYVNDYLKFPEAEELVVFLKRAIATPKAPFVPGLPFFLLVSKDFRCYESAIGKFLDPIQLHSRQRFGWWIEGLQRTRYSRRRLVKQKSAKQCTTIGNRWQKLQPSRRSEIWHTVLAERH